MELPDPPRRSRSQQIASIINNVVLLTLMGVIVLVLVVVTVRALQALD